MPEFVEVAEESGLQFEHSFGADRLDNILMTTGSGASFLDYDNDGWLDAWLLTGTALDQRGRVVLDGAASHALFRSDHGRLFRRAEVAAGVAQPSYGMGITTGDVDGDGLVDVYVTNYGANALFRNLGDGTFEDVTKASGTAGDAWSTGAVLFDFDSDSDLDLYVANYLRLRPDEEAHASSLSKRGGMRFFPSPRDYEAAPDVLYRNRSDGRFTFEDVSAEAGIRGDGKGFSPVALDFDEDGDQDLFVANDATPNFLYRNDGGVFTEVGLGSGAAFDPQGVETGAMGVDVADVDGDGRQDLYVTNFIFEFNNLYRNLGDLTFVDVTKASGLDDDNYRYVGWATRLADFNNDGRLDCFVANGHVTDYVEGFSDGITYGQRNQLFLGTDNGRFENVSGDVGREFRARRVSRGAAFGDYDNDGDIDILVSNSGGRAELLRNDLESAATWIRLRLVGRSTNRQAIGARVRVVAGTVSWSFIARVPHTYLSSSDPTLHTGLPAGTPGAEVEVVWPSGTRSRVWAGAATTTTIREPPAPERDPASASGAAGSMARTRAAPRQ